MGFIEVTRIQPIGEKGLKKIASLPPIDWHKNRYRGFSRPFGGRKTNQSMKYGHNSGNRSFGE